MEKKTYHPDYYKNYQSEYRKKYLNMRRIRDIIIYQSYLSLENKNIIIQPTISKNISFD